MTPTCLVVGEFPGAPCSIGCSCASSINRTSCITGEQTGTATVLIRSVNTHTHTLPALGPQPRETFGSGFPSLSVQAVLEVCDRTGRVCVVLWNSVCVDWYRCLKPGDIVSLRRYRVKQQYQAELDDIGTNKPRFCRRNRLCSFLTSVVLPRDQREQQEPRRVDLRPPGVLGGA